MPIKDFGIPIEVRNLNSKINGNAPTVIGPNIIDSNQLKAVGCLRSVAKITTEIGDIENQGKILGQILIQMDKENITCWSVESNPSTIDIVVSQQQLTVAENIIQAESIITNVDLFSCLISFIGTNDRNIVEEQLKKAEANYSDLIYLNSTKLSVQYVANTVDIKQLMENLSAVVAKKRSV